VSVTGAVSGSFENGKAEAGRCTDFAAKRGAGADRGAAGPRAEEGS
jgi:hypothetical protein